MENGVLNGGELISWPTPATPHRDCAKCKKLYNTDERKPQPAPCDKCITAKANAESYMGSIKTLIRSGWTVRPEVKYATDGLGQACDWKSKDAYIRSIVDVEATHSFIPYTIIIDWKTGEKWEEDDLQLDINALTSYPTTGNREFVMAFAYLDGNTPPSEHNRIVDLDEPAMFDPKLHAHTSMLQTMMILHNLKRCYATDKWVEQKNKFCGWCDVTSCKHYKPKG